MIKRHPSLQKISFVGHSLGGLIARYAVASLYEQESPQNSDDTCDKGLIEEPKERIGGLEPVCFITSATPHLGSRGHKQVDLRKVLFVWFLIEKSRDCLNVLMHQYLL